MCLFIKLGKVYDEDTLDQGEIDSEVKEIFERNNMTVDNRIIRTYTILLFFTVKVRLRA